MPKWAGCKGANKRPSDIKTPEGYWRCHHGMSMCRGVQAEFIWTLDEVAIAYDHKSDGVYPS